MARCDTTLCLRTARKAPISCSSATHSDAFLMSRLPSSASAAVASVQRSSGVRFPRMSHHARFTATRAARPDAMSRRRCSRRECESGLYCDARVLYALAGRATTTSRWRLRSSL